MGIAHSVFALIFNSPTDWLLVVLIAVVLFGGKKLSDIGKGLGEGIRNFKDGMKSDDDAKKQ
jgi:sec-independent protein translocase protein TatA